MEAEAAARQENRAAHAGVPLHLHPASMYGHELKPMVHEQMGRPSTGSPGASSMSSMSPQYPPIKYGQPTGQHASGQPMSYPASYPRYPSYMPTPNLVFDGFRPPLDPLQQQPLSSASAVSQFPVLQTAGAPPGYQIPLSGNQTREHAYSLARHVGSISHQASHLAYEQEALRHNAEELRQETGVILESLSSGSDQALADNQGKCGRKGNLTYRLTCSTFFHQPPGSDKASSDFTTNSKRGKSEFKRALPMQRASLPQRMRSREASLQPLLLCIQTVSIVVAVPYKTPYPTHWIRICSQYSQRNALH